MHSQVSAERQKRALILESEGSRQSAINRAEGEKQSRILASEGDRTERINLASGEADATVARAKAAALAIQNVSKAISEHGTMAVSLMVAEKYIEAFSQLAQKSTSLLLPMSASDPASMITQALAVFGKVSKGNDLADIHQLKK